MNNALVVIDVQKYFMDENTRELPGKIEDYIEKNKDKFDYIVFFKFINNEETAFFKYYEWDEMMKSPEIDFPQEIQRISSIGKIFKKSTRSCLRNKKFKNFLEDNKIQELYLCGLNTEECILSTALDGFDCGFKIFVLKDLCASYYGEDIHKKSLDIMKKQFEVI